MQLDILYSFRNFLAFLKLFFKVLHHTPLSLKNHQTMSIFGKNNDTKQGVDSDRPFKAEAIPRVSHHQPCPNHVGGRTFSEIGTQTLPRSKNKPKCTTDIDDDDDTGCAERLRKRYY